MRLGMIFFVFNYQAINRKIKKSYLMGFADSKSISTFATPTNGMGCLKNEI